MENERASSANVLSGVADERAAGTRRLIALSLILLLVTTGICGAMYFYRLPSLDGGALLRFGLAGIVGVGGIMLLLIKFATGPRAELAARVRELKEAVQQAQTQKALLQNRFFEAEKARDALESSHRESARRLSEAEQQVGALTRSNTALQEELNKRNRAERALTQRRQELESSKSVLEIHVEARTQELQKLQRRYELILNSAGEGICGLDLEGRATFVNPAVERMTGWKIEELIGKSEKEIFYPNGSSDTDILENHSAKEQLFHHKNGRAFPVEFVKTAINENGKAVGSVLVFKDITERRQVENSLARKADELARSNAELEQFAFVASHDLQEPLRKIQAFGDRLKVKVNGDQSAEARDYLDRMQKAAARMQTLINDLLAFSRVIRGSQPFVPVNLATVTREVLGDLEVRIEKTGAKVEIGDLPTIDADPLQMRQLMLNLIGNALKFQRPGNTPQISVTSRFIKSKAAGKNSATSAVEESKDTPGEDSLCEISIRDNGIGFDEKYLERIFVVFQRLEGRSDYEGTGVGLAVCRRITDRHSGKVTAKSKPGEGSTFIVTLPVKQSKTDLAQ